MLIYTFPCSEAGALHMGHGTSGELLDLCVSDSASAKCDYYYLLHREGSQGSRETRPAI